MSPFKNYFLYVRAYLVGADRTIWTDPATKRNVLWSKQLTVRSGVFATQPTVDAICSRKSRANTGSMGVHSIHTCIVQRRLVCFHTHTSRRQNEESIDGYVWVRAW